MSLDNLVLQSALYHTDGALPNTYLSLMHIHSTVRKEDDHSSLGITNTATAHANTGTRDCNATSNTATALAQLDSDNDVPATQDLPNSSVIPVSMKHSTLIMRNRSANRPKIPRFKPPKRSTLEDWWLMHNRSQSPYEISTFEPPNTSNES